MTVIVYMESELRVQACPPFHRWRDPMRRITTLALGLATLALASSAFAAAVPNSAVLHLRVFNDCPISILNTTNTFPGLININDQNPVCLLYTSPSPRDR